ncbi:hypothetical protein DFH07DRAFT_807937 [Mycena maculata]|uniref:Uncharacterized protein n=1 Tax=Mycena maculata TaxID=230809 RepID=A0AAD7NP05_9AGAR|nr:hypothetical protein DFH07DRAFT_807937 [Mycena maculata]
MSYKLRSGVRLYAVGFVVNQQQMAAIAGALPSSFTDSYGKDGVLALKWHVTRHQFEVLDTVDPENFFVAVHFYPWYFGRDPPPSDVAAIPRGRRDLWQDTYGQHAPGSCVEVSYVYPKFIGSPYFLPDYVENVVANHKLWELLEPIESLVEISPASSFPHSIPIV